MAFGKINNVAERETSHKRPHADVAELADALDSGSSERKFMWVQVPSPAELLKSEAGFRLIAGGDTESSKETFRVWPWLRFQALDAGGNEFPRRF